MQEKVVHEYALGETRTHEMDFTLGTRTTYQATGDSIVCRMSNSESSSDTIPINTIKILLIGTRYSIRFRYLINPSFPSVSNIKIKTEKHKNTGGKAGH